jgi:hypothetical protein
MSNSPDELDARPEFIALQNAPSARVVAAAQRWADRVARIAALKIKRDKDRDDRRAARVASKAERKPISQDIAAVMRSESKKRAAPWEDTCVSTVSRSTVAKTPKSITALRVRLVRDKDTQR